MWKPGLDFCRSVELMAVDSFLWWLGNEPSLETASFDYFLFIPFHLKEGNKATTKLRLLSVRKYIKTTFKEIEQKKIKNLEDIT